MAIAVTMLIDGVTIRYDVYKPNGWAGGPGMAPVVIIGEHRNTVRIANPGERPDGWLRRVHSDGTCEVIV